MINYVIKALTQTSSVTDLIPAQNIFPLFRLQGQSLPAITVQLVDTQVEGTHDMVQRTFTHTVEITTFHENPADAWDACVAIRGKLDGTSLHATLPEVRFVTQATDVFEVTEAFSVTQRYTVYETQ